MTDPSIDPLAVAADALAYMAAMGRGLHGETTTTEVAADIKTITAGWGGHHRNLVMAFTAGVAIAAIDDAAQATGRDRAKVLQDMIYRAAGA